MLDKNKILFVKEEVSVPHPYGKGRGTTFKFGQIVTVTNSFREQSMGHVVKVLKKNSTVAYPFSPKQIEKYFTWEK